MKNSETLQEKNVRLFGIFDPFGFERVQSWLEPGQTPRQILDAYAVPRELFAHVWINGEPVPESEFETRTTPPRALVNIRVVPGKSKNPLRVILGVVALAAAAFLPVLVPGLAGFGLSVGRAVLGLVGASFLGGLAPPPRPRSPGLQSYSGVVGTPPPQYFTQSGSISSTGGEKETLIPSITGTSNKANQYGVIPRVYSDGYKMFPVLAAQPVTEISGNDQYLIMLLTCGYGPLDISDLRIGNTPLNAFTGVNFEIKEGASTDTPISIYPSDVSETTIGTVVTVAGGAVTRAAQQPADRLSVDISFEQGLANTFNILQKVELDVEYRLAGSSDPWVKVTNTVTANPSDASLICEENNTAIVRRNITWNVTRGIYEIRITRLTADNTNGQIVDTSYFATLRAIKNEDPIQPIKDQNGNEIYLSKIALRIKATNQLNGIIDNLSCIVKSKLITWNGSGFTSPTITANPAWIYMDILTGTANKRAVSTSRLDLVTLKAWADACDAETPPRKFNTIYDARTTVFEAMRDVAATGRASVTLKDGKYSVLMDREQTEIVQHITPRNSRNFSAHKVWIDQPHALHVRFVNPDTGYQQDTRDVYDDGYNADGSGGLNAATKFETLQLFGCADADQAWKDGRYHLAVGRLRPETYTWEMDFEHLVLTRGDLVRMTHDVPMWGLGHGRITSLVLDGSDNITAINLDTTLEMATGRQYSVRIRNAENVSILKEINTVNGENTTLTFTTPILAAATDKPAAGDLVQFGELNSESVELIIQKVEPGPDLTAKITAVDHAPEVYTADTGTIPEYDPQITMPPDVQVPVENAVILNYRSDEAVLIPEIDGSLTSQIQVTMQPPADVTITQFECQFKTSVSNTWSGSFFTPVSQGVISIKPVQDGVQYDFRVRCQRNTGAVSAQWTVVTNHLVIGKTTPPPDVPVLYTTNSNTILNWRYDPSVNVTIPADHEGFRVKFNTGVNTSWSSATLAQNLQTATSFDMSMLPAGTLTLMVKAVDVAGNESTNAAILTRDFGDPETANVVETTQYDPTFPGTITNGSIVANVLEAASGGGLFWSGDDNGVFWSGVDANLFYGSSYLPMQWETTYTPQNTLVPPFDITLDDTIEGETVLIEYKTASQALFYDNTPGADNNPHWTDDNALYWAGDNPYVPWPGQISGQNVTYNLRVSTGASATQQGKISRFRVVADAPDIEERLSDVVIAPGGTRLPVTQTYRRIKHVIVTLFQDLINYPAARTVEILDREFVSAGNGPLIAVYDASHNSVAGKVDVLIQGY